MEQLKLDDILHEKKVEDAPKEEPVDQGNAKLRHREKEAKAIEEGKAPKEEHKEEKKEEVKVEKKEEIKKEEPSAKERAYYAAAMDERRKRQALETQLAQFQAKPKEEGEKKTFWDDPEAALETFRKQTLAESKKESLNTRLNTSELIARSRYKDFDEKIEVFRGLIGQNPGLYQQFENSTDPGEFVYKTAKLHKDLQEAGNIDNLRAQIEKETRIKIEAELKEKEDKLKKERAALPGTLSDVRGTKQQAVVWDGPSPLDEILKP